MKSVSIFKTIAFIPAILLASCATNQERQSSVDPKDKDFAGFELIQNDTLEPVNDTLMENTKSMNAIVSETNSCVALLNPLYTTFQAKDDHSLLIILDEIYSLDKENYNNKRNSSGLSAWLPSYGSGSYSSGKTSVSTLKEKYRGQVSFRFDETDQRQLLLSFVDKETAKDMYDAFIKCIHSTQNMPRLYLISNNKQNVICELYLPPNAHSQRTRVVSIRSGNLTLNKSESDIADGSKIRYGNPYNIVFNRNSNENAGEITVAIEKEQGLNLGFGSVVDTPVCYWKWVSSDDDGTPFRLNSVVSFNYKKRTIQYRNTDGTLRESKWVKGPVIGKILTKFNSDSIIITAVHPSYNQYVKYAGYELITYPGSKIVDIKTTIIPTKKTTSVVYTIYYMKIRKVCEDNVID